VHWNELRSIDDRCTLLQRESGMLLDVFSLSLLRDTAQQLSQVVSLRIANPECLFTGTSYGWNTSLIPFTWLRDDGLLTPDELVRCKKFGTYKK
jgi:hypothetical protein